MFSNKNLEFFFCSPENNNTHSGTCIHIVITCYCNIRIYHSLYTHMLSLQTLTARNIVKLWPSDQSVTRYFLLFYVAFYMLTGHNIRVRIIVITVFIEVIRLFVHF